MRGNWSSQEQNTRRGEKNLKNEECFHEETWNKKQKGLLIKQLLGSRRPCRLLFKHKFIKVIEATYHTFFRAWTSSVFTENHQTDPTQAPTVRHFEMYYSSCKGFSSNYKSVQIFRGTRGPKFPNLESQTSLKHLIYLPVPSSSLFHFSHMLSTPFV